jgi:hypothetical protein
MDNRFCGISAGADELHSFGWLRGIRERAWMLELRKKSGNVLAVAYSWIECVEFDPTEGILLQVHSDTIRIKGRNFNAQVRSEVRLFQGIARHRVAWIKETEESSSVNPGERITIVEEIVW